MRIRAIRFDWNVQDQRSDLFVHLDFNYINYSYLYLLLTGEYLVMPSRQTRKERLNYIFYLNLYSFKVLLRKLVYSNTRFRIFIERDTTDLK